MRSRLAKTLTGIGLIAALGLPALPAQAAPSGVKHYANCTAVHRVYSGGIAKSGVKYNKVSGINRALKGNVKHSTALYNANRKMDRDHDGVLCEKS